MFTGAMRSALGRDAFQAALYRTARKRISAATRAAPVAPRFPPKPAGADQRGERGASDHRSAALPFGRRFRIDLAGRSEGQPIVILLLAGDGGGRRPGARILDRTLPSVKRAR
jgi:hypothetical protein